MELALAIAFSLIIVAPFLGRWRANVWLRANMPQNAELPVSTVIEIA